MENAQDTSIDPAKGAPLTLARCGRLLMFFCSFGFLFPKAAVEGMDLTGLQARSQGKLYDKK